MSDLALKRKRVEYLRARYEDSHSADTIREYIYGLGDMGDALYDLQLFDEAREVYQEMLDLLNKDETLDIVGISWLSDKISITYQRLGQTAKSQGRLEEAKNFYYKALEINLVLARVAGTESADRSLSTTYGNLGEILMKLGRLEEARDYCEKSLEIRLALAKKTGTVESRIDLAISYWRMSDIAEAQERLEEAREYYEKALDITLVLAEETGTLQGYEYLQINYIRFSIFLFNYRLDIGKAKEMLQKVVEIGTDSGYPQLMKRADKAKEILSQFF